MAFHKLLKRDSNELFIVFSSINCPEGKFRFYKGFSDREANVLYLNCNSNSWYLEGVPSLGEDVDETMSSIRSIISENEIDKVSTFGSSMGAYGAVLYGSLLNASEIYAGCPEFELGIKGGFYNKYNNNKPENKVYDLLKGYRGSMNVFVSEESYVDLKQAASFKKYGVGVVNVIPNDFHGVFESINFSVGVNALISSIRSIGSPVVVDTIDSDEFLNGSELLYKAFEMIREMSYSNTILEELSSAASKSSCKYLTSHCYFLGSVISMHCGDNEMSMGLSRLAIIARKACAPSSKMISHHIRVSLNSGFGKKEDVADVIVSLRRLRLCSSVEFLESNRSVKLRESLALIRKASFEFRLPILRAESVI